MSRRNRIRLGDGHERWIFAARYDECLRCPLALECIGEALPKVSCRQVAYRVVLPLGSCYKKVTPGWSLCPWHPQLPWLCSLPRPEGRFGWDKRPALEGHPQQSIAPGVERAVAQPTCRS